MRVVVRPYNEGAVAFPRQSLGRSSVPRPRQRVVARLSRSTASKKRRLAECGGIRGRGRPYPTSLAACWQRQRKWRAAAFTTSPRWTQSSYLLRSQAVARWWWPATTTWLPAWLCQRARGLTHRACSSCSSSRHQQPHFPRCSANTAHHPTEHNASTKEACTGGPCRAVVPP